MDFIQSDDGTLKKATARFGRQNRKQVTVNYWDSCTYVHLRNLKNDKCISLGIEEYEELHELLLDDLEKIDRKFQKEVSKFYMLSIILLYIKLGLNLFIIKMSYNIHEIT